MGTRFEVQLMRGDVVEIGGMPICSAEKREKLFPEYCKAQAAYEKAMDTEVDNLKDADKAGQAVDDVAPLMEEYAYQICAIFNKDLDRDSFVISPYDFQAIKEIWLGLATDEKKTN